MLYGRSREVLLRALRGQHPLPLKQKQRKSKGERNEKSGNNVQPQMFHFEPPVLYDHPDDGGIGAD